MIGEVSINEHVLTAAILKEKELLVYGNRAMTEQTHAILRIFIE